MFFPCFLISCLSLILDSIFLRMWDIEKLSNFLETHYSDEQNGSCWSIKITGDFDLLRHLLWHLDFTCVVFSHSLYLFICWVCLILFIIGKMLLKYFRMEKPQWIEVLLKNDFIYFNLLFLMVLLSIYKLWFVYDTLICTCYWVGKCLFVFFFLFFVSMISRNLKDKMNEREAHRSFWIVLDNLSAFE